MLGLLWLVCTRGSGGDQCVALLMAEVLYSGLHVKPLLPLLQSDPQSDEAFIYSFTTPLYFAGELALLWLLGTASPIREVLPATIFGVHAAFHVFFTLLSGVAPVWAVEQNNSRIQNGWNVQTLGGAWAVLLNLLNFTDFSLHAAYTALLCVPLFQGSVTTLENQFLAAGIPVGSLVAGVLMYSVIGEVLPDKLHTQAPSRVAKVATEDLQLYGSLLQRTPTSSPLLRGKTVLVTGGSSGIGKELARMLFRQGAQVIITSPSYERATKARCTLVDDMDIQDDVSHSIQHGDVEAMQLDLSCPRSIARFAERLRAKYDHLDIVVHNAATSNWWPYRESDEGIEINMAVNHLGPFRLTQLMLPLIARGSESDCQRGRVVVVASSAYKLFTTSAGINLAALAGATSAQDGYTPWRAYGDSKLANILFARELSRRFGKTAFDVVAIDPGNTMSGLQRNMGLLGVVLNGVTKTLGGSPLKAASNVFRAACSTAYTGRQFVFVEEEREAELKERGRDDRQARELWKISEKLSQEVRSLQKEAPRDG